MNRILSLYARPKFVFQIRRNRRFAAAAIAFLEQFPLDSAVELVV